MAKIVITEKHILFITLGISLVSLGIGIYNIYGINSILNSQSPYSSLPEIGLPSISQFNPVYGNSSDIIVFEYLDYLCPYCAMFDTQTFPELEGNYINKGNVTYVVKNFIIHGQQAENLAIYATCVYLDYGLQSFLDFKYSIYEALYNAVFVNNNYTDYEIALNNTLAKYNVSNCLSNTTLINEIKNAFATDYNEAMEYKLTGTPGFVILIKKDLLSESSLKNIINLLDQYKSYGLQYNIWLSNDGKYVVISFAGALPYDFFNALFSSI